jgi:hypothetical protein
MRCFLEVSYFGGVMLKLVFTQRLRLALLPKKAAASADRPGQQSASPVKELEPEFGTYEIENHPDHEAAAGANSNVLLVPQIVEHDLESVAAGARVVVHLERFVEGHIFDLDLIVDGKLFVVRHFGCD